MNGCLRAAIIAAGLVMGAACAAAPAKNPSDTPAPQDEVVVTDVMRQGGQIAVVTVNEETWSGRLTAPAVLKLDDRRTARIGALVEGVVTLVSKEVGDAADQNDTLATLHTHLTHDAWADLRKAQSEVIRLAAELEFVRRNSERALRLLADKAIAEQEAERAVVSVGSVEQQLASAQAEASRALEELEHLGIAADIVGLPGVDRDRVPVRTPQRGRVIERLVTPGSTVTPGQPLFVVSDLSVLWAIAEVDERHLGLLRSGASVELEVAAYPAEMFPAIVLAIGDVIDPLSRRVQVRCEVPNADSRLKPEMFASVHVATTADTAVVIPVDAVQRSGEQSVVFVETRPNRFTMREVRIGQARDGRVVVLEGIRAGERIAAKGAFLLKSELRQASTQSE